MKGELKFYSILDFYPRKKEIKIAYDKLSIEEKRLYKKEVYSLCWEDEGVKDLIWEYLNDWEYSLPDLARQWRIKKERAKKYENRYTSEIRKLE